tara:strand:- start:363 stop:659 length:297 start_codon:yes stop_codon:yes gene_type:complete
MLNYKFNSKLVSTTRILKELDLPVSQLDFWKTQWRKKGNDCWDMGLRLIGNKALWDPIVFLNWIFENKLKNKPKDLMERAENKKLIAFIKRNASAESE